MDFTDAFKKNLHIFIIPSTIIFDTNREFFLLLMNRNLWKVDFFYP